MPTNDDMYLSQDRVRVEVDTMPGLWMQASGFGGESDVTAQRPGVGADPVQLHTRQKLTDVTLVKMFNSATDHSLLRRLNSGDKFRGSVLTSVDVDEDDNTIPGTTSTSRNCSVKSWALSDTDVNGADARTLSVTFARTSAV